MIHSKKHNPAILAGFNRHRRFATGFELSAIRPKMGRLCLQQTHRAFTLFELILAIALSVTLLALICTAINLYLTRIDTSRSEVEEAQLARSVLTMIANDIRATTIYKPQDTSSIMALAASTAAFDVDSLDKPKASSGGSGGSSSGSSTSGGLKTIKTASGSGGTSSSGASSTGSKSSSGSGSSSSNSSNSDTNQGATDSLPLGLNGSTDEVYIDISRLPNMEELFGSATGYTNASAVPAAANATTTSTVRPSDIKSVCYFVREGAAIDPSSGATALSTEAQAKAGGLVRQEVDRAARTWAEQSGSQGVLESGQVLIAPEVTSIEFSYFDGSQSSDTWDMNEEKTLPKAIEVRIWISSSSPTTTADGTASDGHEYRQTVYVPMASLSGSGSAASASANGATTPSSSSTSSQSSGSSFGSVP